MSTPELVSSWWEGKKQKVAQWEENGHHLLTIAGTRGPAGERRGSGMFGQKVEADQITPPQKKKTLARTDNVLLRPKKSLEFEREWRVENSTPT